MSHVMDYTREEKIRLTALACGIDIPTKALTKPWKQNLFIPKAPPAPPKTSLVSWKKEKTILRVVRYVPGWGSVRKKAFNNLLLVTACSYCEGQGTFDTGPDSKKWHIDHIVPSSKGGTNEMSNLCKACHSCNVKKGAKFIRPLQGTLKADGSVE